MSNKIAVFDLDGTIGDFIAIDFFSYLYDEETIKYYYKKQYESYPKQVKEYLKDLEKSFEKVLYENGFTKIWLLRDNIDDIFDILKKKIEDKSLIGCMIYSNNGNIYNLEFAGRAIERLMESNNIFIKSNKNDEELNIYKGKKLFINYDDKIRNTYNIPIERARYKKVNTIEKAVKKYIDINIEPEEILFLDDQFHQDMENHHEEITYIKLLEYIAPLSKHDLFDLFNTFNDTCLEMFKKHKTMKDTFFKLDHMKQYFMKVPNGQINEFKILKNKYIEYTYKYMERRPYVDTYEKYVEDNKITIRKINNFFNPIRGGKKRKNKTFKKKYNYK